MGMELNGFGAISDEVAELIAARKSLEGDRSRYQAPAPGRTLEVQLTSDGDHPVKFVLSVYEGRRTSNLAIGIEVDRKTSMQTRRGSTPLVRIDLDPHARHTNPDGTTILGPHLHVATSLAEWRHAVPLDGQAAIPGLVSYDTPMEVFEPFRDFCNIDSRLIIEWNLGV